MEELEKKDTERKTLLEETSTRRGALDSSLDDVEVLDGKEEEQGKDG